MKIIDVENWDRKEHYAHFLRADYPQINVCANIDITKFLKLTKDRRLTFYYAMVFAATAAANSIENFRYRIRDDGVVLHETVHPSFTALNAETDLFKCVAVNMTDDIGAFIRTAQKIEKAQHSLFGDDGDEKRDDLIYITSLPWISFTSISHTITLDKKDSIPRISWGRHFAEGDRTLLPFSVQVHHALVDGVHVGKYFAALDAFADIL